MKKCEDILPLDTVRRSGVGTQKPLCLISCALAPCKLTMDDIQQLGAWFEQNKNQGCTLGRFHCKS